METVLPDFDSKTGPEADLRRRRVLRAFKNDNNLTLVDLARLVTSRSAVRVSPWTIKSWLADQDAKRARLCPYWAVYHLTRHDSRDQEQVSE